MTRRLEAEEADHPIDGQIVDPEEPTRQMMTVDRHDEIVSWLIQQSTEDIEAAKFQTSIAQGLLEMERDTTRHLRTLLQITQNERRDTQMQLYRTDKGCRDSLLNLERQVLKYPVEEKKAGYKIDRSVVCHMIQDSYDEICDRNT